MPKSVPIFWRNHGVYDVTKLWKITNKEETKRISITKLLHNLDKDYWTVITKNGKKKYVTPNQVLKNPKIAMLHYQAILDADLSYPLIIYKDNDDLDILDGLHRLAKSVKLGRKTVKVKIATYKMLDYARIK